MASTSRQKPPTARKPIPSGKAKSSPSPTTKPKSKAGGLPSKKPQASEQADGLFGILPVGMVIHGVQGVGKTELAAHFPDVGFVINRKERGIIDLQRAGSCPKPVFVKEFGGRDLSKDPQWEEMLEHNYDIASGAYPGVKTVVFDSATVFETMAFRFHANRDYEGNFGKDGYFAYGQGPKECAKTLWTDFLDSLETIKDEGINVILIAHTRVKPFNNPLGADYDRYIPYMDADVWNQTLGWAQIVLFYCFDVSTEKKGVKTKVRRDSQQRMLYAVRSEAFDAKNRFGMSPAFMAGDSGEEAFNNFADEFKRCFKDQ